MSCKNGSKHMETKCPEPPKNKLDRFIKDCQGGIVTLQERQFNCPPCSKSDQQPCRIPPWIQAPCDGLHRVSFLAWSDLSSIGVKCFNCPPKYLCFDSSSCQLVSGKPAIKTDGKHTRMDEIEKQLWFVRFYQLIRVHAIFSSACSKESVCLEMEWRIV